MKRYDSYKDSGVKWLGEIPSHWEVKRWRFLMNENVAKNNNCNVRLQLQFKYGDIVRKSNQSEEKDVLETISKYTVVEPDDIMINGLNLNYDFISQRVARVREEGAITSAYVSLRPTEIADSRFYTYFLKSMDAKKMFHGMGTGIRLTLSYNELKNQFLPKPSLKEQEAIANYLDVATSKIDEAIAQQQKMIDLLNERKQIIINNAVTKGLDPNVKMKPSGIDWIGDIPEHWEVRKIKTIVEKVGSGITPRGGGSVYVDEGVMLLRSQNVYFEGFKLNDVAHITDAIDKNMSNTRVKEGDVLLNITGGSIGRCYFVPNGFPRANVNQHVCIVRPLNFSTKYLYYLLRSKCCQVQVDLQQTGGNREGLTSSAIKNFVIPIPPVNEQNAIIEYLDVRDKDLQSSIEICNKQISLLQERKQIIINDVVTGKVKVI